MNSVAPYYLSLASGTQLIFSSILAAADGISTMTFRAAMRLPSSKDSVSLRTKALSVQLATLSPTTLPSLLSRQPTQESYLQSISQICNPKKSLLASHLASGSLVGALRLSV